MLSEDVLQLSLIRFGRAFAHGLFQLQSLVRDSRTMLASVSDSAVEARRAAEAPEWQRLLDEAGKLEEEKAWTIGELQRLAREGDPRADILGAPLAQKLFEAQAVIREVNAAAFPPLVWSSVAVTAFSQWEVILRAYPEYLSHHLRAPGLDNAEAVGVELMKGFKTFVKRLPEIGFDFSIDASWQDMNDHRRVRNLIVHWGGRLSGTGAHKVEQFIEQRDPGLERHGGFLVCQERYADMVVQTVLDFLIQFDEALRERLPHL